MRRQTFEKQKRLTKPIESVVTVNYYNNKLTTNVCYEHIRVTSSCGARILIDLYNMRYNIFLSDRWSRIPLDRGPLHCGDCGGGITPLWTKEVHFLAQPSKFESLIKRLAHRQRTKWAILSTNWNDVTDDYLLILNICKHPCDCALFSFNLIFANITIMLGRQNKRLHERIQKGLKRGFNFVNSCAFRLPHAPT